MRVTDRAEKLITWLRRRTFVLARIREVQRSLGNNPTSVLRAVKTRWTSHYHAFCRLLQLQKTLQLIVAEDDARGPGDSTFMAGIKKKDAKKEAEKMIRTIKDSLFWQNLTR